MWWNETFCFEFDGKSMETQTTWSGFPNEGKAIVELASGERNKLQTAGKEKKERKRFYFIMQVECLLLMFWCLQIFCIPMLNVSTTNLQKMNVSTTFPNLLISLKLLTVIHSFPVCIMCVVIPSHWISSFFQLN